MSVGEIAAIVMVGLGVALWVLSAILDHLFITERKAAGVPRRPEFTGEQAYKRVLEILDQEPDLRVIRSQLDLISGEFIIRGRCVVLPGSDE